VHAKTAMPKKRSKKNPLAATDKARNRATSSERVPCENVIAMLTNASRLSLTATEIAAAVSACASSSSPQSTTWNSKSHDGYARGLMFLRARFQVYRFKGDRSAAVMAHLETASAEPSPAPGKALTS
jgi:hypothetical protein